MLWFDALPFDSSFCGLRLSCYSVSRLSSGKKHLQLTQASSNRNEQKSYFSHYRLSTIDVPTMYLRIQPGPQPSWGIHKGGGGGIRTGGGSRAAGLESWQGCARIQTTHHFPALLLLMRDSWLMKRKYWQCNLGHNKVIKHCCLLIITESWLDSLTLGVAIKLGCYTVHRPDRSSEYRKSKGGVCACMLMITGVKKKKKNSRQRLSPCS